MSSGLKLRELSVFILFSDNIFITSSVFLKLTDSKKTEIIISKHSGLKCERCWKYFNKLFKYEGANQLCDRCLNNLN